MRHGKKPTRAQKIRIGQAGLAPCTGTTYLRNAGKGGTGGGKCGKGPILGGFAAGWPRNRGGMSQLF